MICPDCDFESEGWEAMRKHYKKKHPLVKNPSRFFTREARNV